ncbi:MAG: hypothetical protein HQ472_00305 [Ignavibacteria bacterium]|nr:hypothetical protein [Ignavibacteria bacterium]
MKCSLILLIAAIIATVFGSMRLFMPERVAEGFGVRGSAEVTVTIFYI